MSGALAERTALVGGDRIAELRADAADSRLRDVRMIARAGLGHVGGDFSALDILTVLYREILQLDPSCPSDPTRDRFVLSKGHASGALYVTLAKRGFFPIAELDEFLRPLGRLGGHPDKTKLPGVEASTGPLGHGLPIAVGMALAAKLSGARYRTFVLTGDGELQEGSNWEAAMSAAHHGLDNLVVTVDRNRLQQGDATERTVGLEPLAEKWRAFGWAVEEVDGHDHAALLAAYRATPFRPGQPSCLLARTHKGEGVSFMRDEAAWHHKVPSPKELAAAVIELEGRA